MSDRPLTDDQQPSHAFVLTPQPGGAPPRAGPLGGLRLAVKDIFDVEGQVTGAGSPGWSVGMPPAPAHAALVGLLIEAGAAFAGKTVTDELAFSLMGDNAHFPPPRNHAAPNRYTGGSSCGSVAAVGAGEAEIALASDTGGSIRAPASFCGLIGLRATHGRIDMTGCVPLAPSLDTGGWFAADPAIYRAVAELALGPPTPREHAAQAPRALRCPVLEAGLPAASRAVWDDLAERAIGHLGGGWTTLDLGEEPSVLQRCFRVVQAAEAWEMHGPYVELHGAAMNPGVRDRFEWGRDVARDEHALMSRLRESFAAWMDDELGDDGVLLLPTVPGPAPLRESSEGERAAYREVALHLLCIAGLAGLPQLTLPLGEIDGAPFGLSLVGAAGTDRRLLEHGLGLLAASGSSQCVGEARPVPTMNGTWTPPAGVPFHPPHQEP